MQLFFILMTRAQNYVILQQDEIRKQEDTSEAEISLVKDQNLSDQLRFIDYILRRGILKQDLDMSDPNEKTGVETLNILMVAKTNLTSSLDEFAQAKQFSPTQFA